MQTISKKASAIGHIAHLTPEVSALSNVLDNKIDSKLPT
jgi:hypothetical protein